MLSPVNNVTSVTTLIESPLSYIAHGAVWNEKDLENLVNKICFVIKTRFLEVLIQEVSPGSQKRILNQLRP